MLNQFPKLLVTFTALLLCSQLGAQEPSVETDTDSKPRRYTVEIIIFSYEENVAVGSEIFVADSVDPNLPGGQNDDESDSAPKFGDARTTRRMPRFEFNRLSRDQFTMRDTARMLNRLEAYEPLMHLGWTQTTIPEMETPTISLNRLGRPPSGLSGTLNLYLNRYLHLVVDLALDAPASTSPNYSDRPVKPLQYLISEDRIMKNEEIRYYDHPKYGVIAKVIREEPEPESGDPSSSQSAVARGQ